MPRHHSSGWLTRKHGSPRQKGKRFPIKPRRHIRVASVLDERQQTLAKATPSTKEQPITPPMTVVREKGSEARIAKDKKTISEVMAQLPSEDRQKIANIILDYDWMNSGQVTHESMFNQHWQILGDKKAKSMVVKGKDNIVFNPLWAKEEKDFREVVAHEVGHSVFNNLPEKERNKWIERFHDSVKRFDKDFEKMYNARLYEYGTLDRVFDTRINWDLSKYGTVSPYSMNSAQEYFAEHYKAKHLYPKSYSQFFKGDSYA